MKSAGYLLLALAVVPASAQAFDFNLEPDHTRYLADPSYLPAKGELDGESTIGYSDTTEEHYNSSGVMSRKYTANTLTGAQSLTYGLTKRISVSMSETYAKQTAKDAYSSGGTNKFNFSGFEDPAIGLRGRVVPQGKAPFFIDFVGAYSPDLFEAKAATTTTDGSVGRGNQTFGGEMIIGREMKSWTTQLGYAATLNGERKEQVAGRSGSNVMDAYWSYALEWKNQLRFTDSIFLNAGANLNWHEDTVHHPAYAASYVGSEDPGTALYLSPGYVIIPQKMTLSAEFDWRNMGDATENYSDHTESWRNMQELYFGLHLRYKLL